MAEKQRILGIDLGTTNTCVASVRNKIPKVVPTDKGNLILPSVVALSAKEFGEWLDQQTQVARVVVGMESVTYQFLIAFTMREQAKRCALKTIQTALVDGALPVGANHGLPLLRYALPDTAKAHEALEGVAVVAVGERLRPAPRLVDLQVLHLAEHVAERLEVDRAAPDLLEDRLGLLELAVLQRGARIAVEVVVP